MMHMPTPTNPSSKSDPTCFIAMPITTLEDEASTYGDPDHWEHVIESLFVKAVEAAGFTPIRPAIQGAHLIHGQIIRNLSSADLVLCDLSQHNPNVFFELGVRTSLNLPIALVKDERTTIPFDTSGINTHTYDSSLRGWEIGTQQQNLTQHILRSAESCAGQNPLWRHFGLTIKATEPDAHESPLEAKVDLLADRIAQLQRTLPAANIPSEYHYNILKAGQNKRLSSTSDAVLIDEMEKRLEESVRENLRAKKFLSDARNYINAVGAPLKIDLADTKEAHASLTTDGGYIDHVYMDVLHNLARRNDITLVPLFREEAIKSDPEPEVDF